METQIEPKYFICIIYNYLAANFKQLNLVSDLQCLSFIFDKLLERSEELISSHIHLLQVFFYPGAVDSVVTQNVSHLTSTREER